MTKSIRGIIVSFKVVEGKNGIGISHCVIITHLTSEVVNLYS